MNLEWNRIYWKADCKKQHPHLADTTNTSKKSSTRTKKELPLIVAL